MPELVAGGHPPTCLYPLRIFGVHAGAHGASPHIRTVLNCQLEYPFIFIPELLAELGVLIHEVLLCYMQLFLLQEVLLLGMVTLYLENVDVHLQLFLCAAHRQRPVTGFGWG